MYYSEQLLQYFLSIDISLDMQQVSIVHKNRQAGINTYRISNKY